MKRGRKPKPVQLRILAGNPGKRPIPVLVALPPGIPERPTWLDRLARQEWDYVVAELGPVAVLRKVDRMELAGYCCAVSRAIRAERRAQRDSSHEPRAEKAWEQVRKFGALFGLGPAEAQRVAAKAPLSSHVQKYLG